MVRTTGRKLKGDLIARNVAELATPPKCEPREITPFTPEQAGRFLKAAMGHRLEALFTVGLAVGLRSGECSALQWTDVDLERNIMVIRDPKTSATTGSLGTPWAGSPMPLPA